MADKINKGQIAFEHQFWLQILGDHARFILNELSPEESEEALGARYFIDTFDKLLEESRRGLSETELEEFTKRALKHAQEIRGFKLNLIRQHLVGEIKIGLTPTFLNHMVNELDEYIRILNCFLSGKLAPMNDIHHHLLWLLDASGHAEGIAKVLDEVEKRLIYKAEEFKKDFDNLYRRAVEMAGYVRTSIEKFPALTRFNEEVELEMQLFMGYLNEIEKMRLDKEVLGGILPLVPDHMYREECYYLTKLSMVSEVKRPECDPAKPRTET
ncbi:DUF2935 domain-containing protein [Fonticella tunisiensis]|uniref:DUF2935 family protein n=1 Tax=Fonticella tunisiensis TaxID=1096341 RepID=A0A4R7KTL5_9CLOT|nr:DUF2935 domain-containing protein [Fonticella tunisiensis]TDT63353.1 DUF2935 family protein [Fonticella tunisiensis]